MQKITPFLWFDDNAEEAVNFYLSVFKNSKIKNISRYTDALPNLSGKVMTVEFEIDNQIFVALNGGPHFNFTPAISFMYGCNSQEEVDEVWDKIAEGGEIMQCGWVTDKFGVSWQITPVEMRAMVEDKDPEKAKRATEAMMQMKKLDLDIIRKAYNNE